MGSFQINALLVVFALFLQFAVSPVPFVEGSLDTTMGKEDSPIIFYVVKILVRS